MRAGLVIYGDLDQATGGYLYDRMLVREMKERGHRVEVISQERRDYLANLADNLSPSMYRRLRDLEVDLLLEDELNHPSLFHLNDRLRAETSFPIVSIVHNLSRSVAMTEGERGMCGFFESHYLATVDGFVFNSRATMESVLDLLPYLPKGVLAPPGKDHMTVGEGHRPSPPPMRLLFVGSVTPHKGLEVLVEALGLVGGDFTLDVVGPQSDPGYAERVKERERVHGIEDRVRWLGPMGREGIAHLLGGSHLLAVPSFHEGYGIVYVEALAHGVPVIATSFGGAKEIITNGREGFLVDPGDARGLVNVLGRLMDHPDRLEGMGKMASERYLELPTWRESMGRAVDFLETMVD
ncbi:MAG: glycosyltransferase family 4 protein [Methanomassiliicoccales archaeon]